MPKLELKTSKTTAPEVNYIEWEMDVIDRDSAIEALRLYLLNVASPEYATRVLVDFVKGSNEVQHFNGVSELDTYTYYG